MVKDPICGMMVDEKKAKVKSDYMGKTYYFCSPACKTAFDKTPAKFTKSDFGQSCSCGGH